jgi:hypothetical protein
MKTTMTKEEVINKILEQDNILIEGNKNGKYLLNPENISFEDINDFDYNREEVYKPNLPSFLPYIIHKFKSNVFGCYMDTITYIEKINEIKEDKIITEEDFNNYTNDEKYDFLRKVINNFEEDKYKEVYAVVVSNTSLSTLNCHGREHIITGGITSEIFENKDSVLRAANILLNSGEISFKILEDEGKMFYKFSYGYYHLFVNVS